MTTKQHPWAWFTDKVLPPVFAALTISTIAAAFATHQAVQSLTSKIDATDKKIVQLEARIEYVQANAITRSELLETMKRVELQLELMMAKAGFRKK